MHTADRAADAIAAVPARHVLLATPDPGVVIRRWIRLLRPGCRLVLSRS